MRVLRPIVLSDCIALFAMSATVVHGQEKKPIGKGINAATVAAYEKLRAVYGGWQTSGDAIGFEPGRKNAEAGLPAFQFQVVPKTKLPAVDVPFALDLAFSNVTDASLKEIAALKNLTTLSMPFTNVTDVGIKELTPLTNLTWLDLSLTKVSDDGLKHVASLKNLSRLYLDSTKVTDAGLKELAPLKNLTSLLLRKPQVTDTSLRVLREIGLMHTLDGGVCARGKNGSRPKSPDEVISLNLFGTNVTDAGIKELVHLKNLTEMELRKTRVTAAGVAELQKALPKCKISH